MLLFGIFHVSGWLVSSAPDSVEGRAWTAHTAIVSRECFSIPRFQSLDLE